MPLSSDTQKPGFYFPGVNAQERNCWTLLEVSCSLPLERPFMQELTSCSMGRKRTSTQAEGSLHPWPLGSAGSCFLIHSATVCLLIRAFNTFILKVIVDVSGSQTEGRKIQTLTARGVIRDTSDQKILTD